MNASQLGETFDPLGAHLQDPYALYARAREEEPVFWSPRLKAWVVTRYQDVVAVLRDHEAFSSSNSLRPVRELYPETFVELAKGYPPKPDHVTSDGAAHRRLRAPFAKAFSASRIEALGPVIQKQADALIDAFAGDGRVELMRQYAAPLPVQVIAELFGMDAADAAALKAGTEAMFQLGGTDLTPEQEAEAGRGTVAFQQLIGAYVRARRSQPRQDVISEVVAALAPGDGPLTGDQEAELVWLLASTIGAGHITTSDTIGNGVWLLLTHPEQWELLRKRPELARGAVEEIMRFASPVPSIFRKAAREVTVAGKRLPEGSELMLAFISANRDPALCENPETFDITRTPTRHLGFGTGVHACVGNLLARREIQVSLETLARRLPALRVPAGETVLPVRPTVNLRGPLTLELEF